jgi:ribosomal protein S18 acetylase RimI-like enzyme
MGKFEKVFEVMMVRENLTGFPISHLPELFTFRLFRPGDAETWVRIHLEAEPYHHVDKALHEREFDTDEIVLSLRQYFVCTPEGREIATASAWFNDDLIGRNYGRIHWVAVSPDYQGKGIAQALTRRLCERFVELGHSKALVTTENFRTNAIHIYRKFGFVPAPRNGQEDIFWEEFEAERNYGQ